MVLVFRHEDVVKPEKGYLIYKLVKSEKTDKQKPTFKLKKIKFQWYIHCRFLDIDDRIVGTIPTLKKN